MTGSYSHVHTYTSSGGIISMARPRPANPTSSVPMSIGQITPAIFHEALRRTPNHKAAGPDGVPGLVLEHIPPSFHEAIHLLFQVLTITWITPPSWLLQSHTILLYKKGARLGWTTITQSP